MAKSKPRLTCHIERERAAKLMDASEQEFAGSHRSGQVWDRLLDVRYYAGYAYTAAGSGRCQAARDLLRHAAGSMAAARRAASGRLLIPTQPGRRRRGRHQH